jgi:pyruvate-ferredoxin/flavodoxin oxidoreductase
MAKRRMITVEGNEAVASIAHRTNEVIAIYPITPSSSMGEYADAWAAQGRENIWGVVPDVMEMQSEAGAAGAVHGSLQAGALTTTFTASQGLLLMIPNMYKIAGELTAYSMHVSARTVATHALSIFGDHSDVMACRQVGFAMMASGNGQEAHDLALVVQASTLETRVPFLHFFDGFRTSNEVTKVEEMTDDDIRAILDEDAITAHRARALTPDRPLLRGTAQNPDTFFQQREACNGFFDACPDKVQEVMDRFAARMGRQYKLFDYVGHPEAERVVILMGSGAPTAEDTAQYLVGQGEKVGVVKVRLYRPFSIAHFVSAIPASVKAIAVLDRTKESGAIGDPLYLDVVTALREARVAGSFPTDPIIVGGRYGLSSKEFTPGMVKGVFDNLALPQPKNHFTVGIVDDLTHTSIDYDPEFDIEGDTMVRAVFFGLGADGTVGANKNSIKIIGTETPNFAQGYFVYDSKKSGTGTTSHLRFGPKEIKSTYLVRTAGFVACHQFEFLNKLDMLHYAKPGAVFLLNSPFGAEGTWEHLPREVQQDIISKKLRFYVIDAYTVARETGMGTRINTIMQTCFFAISGVLPRDEAIEQIKGAIRKTYSKKGEEIVKRNFFAVDQTLAHLHQVVVPAEVTSTSERPPVISPDAPEFVRNVIGTIIAGRGDSLPVSAFSPDGTWPTATTQWEKRNVAQDVPAWDPAVCIQCNKCAIVCPHAAIRPKVYDAALLAGAPEAFASADARGKEYSGLKFTLQVAVEDCTGCKLCVNTCPSKNKANPGLKAINMVPQLPIREQERANYAFFLDIPDLDRKGFDRINVKNSQFLRPLFEYSGACTGCGETAYVKLVSQLFGDRLLIGNATGCSSIYGGNLPTTPYCTDKNGRGPAWSNSLFEDNAEFTFGMRLAVDSNTRVAASLVKRFAGVLGAALVDELLANQADRSEPGLEAQRARIDAVRAKLAGDDSVDAKRLLDVVDYLAPKSVWAFGGDGWAYDIGYGGLDHVVANNRNINILCMNTEVYSNTGGQASKATPIGASAKFAAAGKDIAKKDLGMMAMNYGSCYVAAIAMGAKDAQAVKAFTEADSFPGPALIIAYSHCIAHGFDLSLGHEQQKLAVESGLWPLYRFDPRRVAEGLPALQIDSTLEPKADIMDFMMGEARFRVVQKMDPTRFAGLVENARAGVRQKMALYKHMSELVLPS